MPKKSKKNKGSVKEVKIRELEYKDELQEYGKVVSMLGDRRVTIKLPDMTDTLGKVGGGMKKRRQFVTLDDVVIVSRRDFQDGKTDVVYKYTEDEVKKLVQYGEIPSWFAKTSAMITDDGAKQTSEDLGFDFLSADKIDIDDI
jgi:translation initiation factor 1A